MFSLSQLDPALVTMLRGLPQSVKIFGSTLVRFGDNQDIDLAIREEDTETLAIVLRHVSKYKLHPVQLSNDVYDNLHNVLSFKNMCVVFDMATEKLVLGDCYESGTDLRFNPASSKAFPIFNSVAKIALKLTRRGSRFSRLEKARAELHLGVNPALALGKIARFALTDEVVTHLINYDAVVAGGFFRDEVDGTTPKDVDIFLVDRSHWENLCTVLAEQHAEIPFYIAHGSFNSRVRKFRIAETNVVIDVIDYSHLKRKEHIVEVFDFMHNMIWWPVADHSHVLTCMSHTLDEVIKGIHARRLVVGDNAWYHSGLNRALTRWQRFRNDGYVADAANIRKYALQVKMLEGRKE